MNETNIGSEGSRGRIDPTEAAFLGPQVSQGPSNQQYISSLSPSEQEKLGIQLIAGIPHLVVPNQEYSELFVNSMELQMEAISVEMLRAWGKELEEEAALIKRLINSPEYLAKQQELNKLASGEAKEIAGNDLGVQKNQGVKAVDGLAEVNLTERYAWLQSLGTVLETAIILKAQQTQGIEGAAGVANIPGAFGIQDEVGVQDSQGNIVGVRETKLNFNDNKFDRFNEQIDGSSEVDEAEASQGSRAPDFLAQSLLLAASEIALISPFAAQATANSLHAEAIIFKESWEAIVKESSYATLVAGWVSAMWGIGLIYQMSAEKIKDYGIEKSKGGIEHDIDFAKNYAEKMLTLVNNPQFLQSLQISMAKASDQPSNALMESLIAKAKLVLLSLALALLAKLEVGSKKDEGWINELDFVGLLNGKTDINQHDLYNTSSIKRALIDEIKIILSGLEPQERDQILFNLLGFMSTNPSVENLLNQQKAFNAVLNQPSFEKGVFDKRPID